MWGRNDTNRGSILLVMGIMVAHAWLFAWRISSYNTLLDIVKLTFSEVMVPIACPDSASLLSNSPCSSTMDHCGTSSVVIFEFVSFSGVSPPPACAAAPTVSPALAPRVPALSTLIGTIIPTLCCLLLMLLRPPMLGGPVDCNVFGNRIDFFNL